MSMSSFMAFALTKSEMKQVVGGQCYYYDNGYIGTCNGAKDCKSTVRDGWATKWCCDGCSTSTWCKTC